MSVSTNWLTERNIKSEQDKKLKSEKVKKLKILEGVKNVKQDNLKITKFFTNILTHRHASSNQVSAGIDEKLVGEETGLSNNGTTPSTRRLGKLRDLDGETYDRSREEPEVQDERQAILPQ